MKSRVIRPDPQREYFFAEGCFIEELCNSKDDPALSIARARLEPGRTTRWHRLFPQTERYVILAGEGVVEVEEVLAGAPASSLAETVSAGDVVVIPPGSRQRIRNSGREDLIFLALCTPRFLVRDYKDDDPAPFPENC